MPLYITLYGRQNWANRRLAPEVNAFALSYAIDIECIQTDIPGVLEHTEVATEDSRVLGSFDELRIALGHPFSL